MGKRVSFAIHKSPRRRSYQQASRQIGRGLNNSEWMIYPTFNR